MQFTAVPARMPAPEAAMLGRLESSSVRACESCGRVDSKVNMSNQPPAGALTAGLETLGWRPAGAPPLRGSVERTASTTWLVSRNWIARGALSARPLTSNVQRVILSMEGDVTITRGSDGPFHLTSKHIVVVDGAVSLTAATSAIWAWCEWQLSTPFHTPLRRDLFMQPLGLSDDTFSLMANTTNVFCAQPGLSNSPGARALTSTLNTIVYAAVLDGLGLPETLSLTNLELLRRALDLIEARHRDSFFTIRELALALSVHQSFLNRLFAHINTTPRRVLEGNRVDSARALLEGTPQHSRETMANVARVAGFASVQQMRSALRRSHLDQPRA